MENKILVLLNQLVDGQNKINNRLDKIEDKIDSVIDQTANLKN